MYRSIYRYDRSADGFNLTPMIDVAFQLIIFFILAGTFASMDKVSLEAPTLASTKRLDDLKLPYKAVVHVLPHTPEAIAADAFLTGQAATWRIGPIMILAGDSRKLTEELTRARDNFAKRKAGDAALAAATFQVEVRADKSVLYSQVKPVLEGVAAAGFQRVHYVAVGSAGK